MAKIKALELNDPEFVEKVLKMTSDERRKLRLDKKYKKRKKKSRRKTEEDLIKYLRDKEIRSITDFISKRKKGDPGLATFQRKFGSWKLALIRAFGDNFNSSKFNYRPINKSLLIKGLKIPSDPSFHLRLLVEFEIYDEKTYKEARRLRPDIFPPINRLKKDWGEMSNLFYVAKRKSLEKVAEIYLNMKMKLGRFPTLDECRKENLHRILDLIEIHGSKKEMDEFLSSVEVLKSSN